MGGVLLQRVSPGAGPPDPWSVAAAGGPGTEGQAGQRHAVHAGPHGQLQTARPRALQGPQVPRECPVWSGLVGVGWGGVG